MIKRILMMLLLFQFAIGCAQSQIKISDKKSKSKFVKLESGTVYDTESDMEWCIGPNKDLTWYEAVIWVYKLRSDDKRWRMPLVNELTYLYESTRNDASGKQFFINDNNHWLWSGSFPGCSNDFSPACVMFFGDGGYSPTNPYYSSKRRVFAVRVNSFIR